MRSKKLYFADAVFFCSPTTAYFLTIGTLSGQEPPGFAVQASKKIGFSKNRIFKK